MGAETIHQDPQFQRKKTAYFLSFMLRHRREVQMYRENGLFVDWKELEKLKQKFYDPLSDEDKEKYKKDSEKWRESSKGWSNVARHQLLSAVMTETMSELLGMPEEEIKWLTNLSLTHDVGKPREQGELTKEQEIEYELKKSQRPLVATSSNFTGFGDWGNDEYILRYVDSSVADKPNQDTTGHWFGARDPSKLPPVIIQPWRQRIEMFKQNKVAEGEMGRSLYGMTTWEKLEEIMITIESNLFNQILEKNPDLVERYTSSSQLTELVEDRIHEKILNS